MDNNTFKTLNSEYTLRLFPQSNVVTITHNINNLTLNFPVTFDGKDTYRNMLCNSTNNTGLCSIIKRVDEKTFDVPGFGRFTSTPSPVTNTPFPVTSTMTQNQNQTNIRPLPVTSTMTQRSPLQPPNLTQPTRSQSPVRAASPGRMTFSPF